MIWGYIPLFLEGNTYIYASLQASTPPPRGNPPFLQNDPKKPAAADEMQSDPPHSGPGDMRHMINGC